ncbi:CubicO group peptidase (beta-lactamase class C family) [Mobilisporobacter senegalensis]|uniref:CubicO group peptidase (Beta-lactamase class C family) n=1 Tax=Mobilisporobacter senegalensis TaxID=1329262 RepID=A0A3N1XVQ6_9FIRM|nr:serine hydrolase domain-containing protein [Mobilisporobacter senegalensis]ROR30358.1 CubicO group peptidase (beta-lactamase class C family) [Mobilisporobacter senegalensis]
MKHQFVKSSLTAFLSLIIAFTPITAIEASSEANFNEDNEYETTKEAASEKANELVKNYGYTSVQYALIDDGEIKISGQTGVYSKSENNQLTKEHMYGIGSISKIFTTVAVLRLVEEGKVDLDTPLVEYIKDFKMNDPRYVQITVRMLLNHSSGLMGSTFNNTVLIGDNDTSAHDKLLEQLQGQRLKADPGTFSVYCNDGFSLAEILIERVSGLSFTQYIRSYFTITLNMNNTKTPKDVFSLEQLAKVYYPGFAKPVKADSYNAIGAGGIYSTAEDVCRFSQIFMKNSKNILTDKSKKAMEEREYLKGIWPEEGDTTTAYGLGWDCVNMYPFNQYGIKALLKNGDTLLYHSSLIVLPEYNIAATVLSSEGDSTYNQIIGQEILLSALKEKGIIKEIKKDRFFYKPIAEAIPEAMKKYEGLYGTMDGLLMVKFDEDDNLILSNTSHPGFLAEKYTYTKDGLFVISWGYDYEGLKFVKEENGNIYIQKQQYHYIPELGQTAEISYMAQKLPWNVIGDELQNKWNERKNQKYFLVNEKYTSQSYMASSVILKLNIVEDIPGYFGNTVILDDNISKSILEIPVAYGRDSSDYSFMEIDGKDYLKTGSYLYLAEDDIPTLSNSQTIFSIDEDGHGKWYKIDKNLADKKIHVKISGQGAFAVYNSNGICINYSYLDGKDEITLPYGSYIVFTGNSGTLFQLSII